VDRDSIDLTKTQLCASTGNSPTEREKEQENLMVKEECTTSIYEDYQSIEIYTAPL